jgi:hypothetical protein
MYTFEQRCFTKKEEKRQMFIWAYAAITSLNDGVNGVWSEVQDDMPASEYAVAFLMGKICKDEKC